jgi:hypothetical protein
MEQHRNEEKERGRPMFTYLRGKRPIIKRSDDQRPIPNIQSPDLLVHVEPLFRREARVCERLEEALRTRRQRPTHEKKKKEIQVQHRNHNITGRQEERDPTYPIATFKLCPFNTNNLLKQ